MRIAGAFLRLGGLLLFSVLALCGCQLIKRTLDDSLAHWTMLGQEAMEDPIQALGGDGIVFSPNENNKPLSRTQLVTADPETLVAYYSPIFVQQRVNTQAQKYPYPPEYDMIGQAHLRHEGNELKSYVAGSPIVYAICKKLPIEGKEHIQLTYTAWYPAHPRMKAIDLEQADIDSCVLRVTLDTDNSPLFYETIAACGCFHKVFVERWVEEAAEKTYGPPEMRKKFSVEKAVKDGIDWEVAGVVDEPREQPRRPVVFLKAGEHKVLGVGSAARLRVPPTAESHPYEMTSYTNLYVIKVDDTDEEAPFFDMKKGGKVRVPSAKKRSSFSL